MTAPTEPPRSPGKEKEPPKSDPGPVVEERPVIETAPETVPKARRGFWQTIEDQLAITPLVKEYLTPVEVNNFWYSLGGVLGISLFLEALTGVILALWYRPDAAVAYSITRDMLQAPVWSVIINFHYWNSFLIFGLVMVHMMRVFISGGYRRGKQGLWLVGVVLASLTFVVFMTGESLHWDEVGFAVPWHIGEFVEAIGLSDALNYAPQVLLNIPTATEKLNQIYTVHISIVPVLLIFFIVMHYFLVKVKGISLPFWMRESGRTAPFSRHIREWVIFGALAIGVVILFAIFLPREPGTAPQLLPSSPLFGSKDGPGDLGYKPTGPIGWTHGMNIFVASFGMEPDIWGTVIGMLVMLGALLIIPFVDPGPHEPETSKAAFNWRKRGWAFLAMAIFWIVLIGGVISNIVAAPG
ncbi:MAG TPA: cytochrome b N-terminal domain-containing protein [Chloroflexia bacterium]|nr:cytochrome b N-terminal domain-containing protein [Chloroflexia bacterium]